MACTMEKLASKATQNVQHVRINWNESSFCIVYLGSVVEYRIEVINCIVSFFKSSIFNASNDQYFCVATANFSKEIGWRFFCKCYID